jgi:hypothetical protein
MNVRPLIKKDFGRASSVVGLQISIIYQLKRHPSKIKVSTEFLIGSSEANAWLIILVSERQKGHNGCFSPGVVRKASPSWKISSLELPPIKLKLGSILPRGRPEVLCSLPKKQA